uniref:Putative Erf family protein n=1 Tax=viral metagenome TaxID=1070528 RepID=A0A6H1ZZ75_9ZZZZ
MSDDHDNKLANVEPRHAIQLHPMVAQAMAANPSAEELSKFLDLQERWEAAQAKKAYTSALVAMKRDLPSVLKRDKHVAFSSSKGNVSYHHTTLASAVDQITPVLSAYGFSFGWEPKTARDQVYVTCRLTHRDGHSECCEMDSPADVSGLKSAAQGRASTVTLLQRYTLLSLLGIATADMVEPGPREPDQDAVDVSRNLKAAAALKKHGRTKQQAEAHLGRPLKEWTASDLQRIRDWLADDVPAEEEPYDGPPDDVLLPEDDHGAE